MGPRTLQIASFACCRYPSCPICPRCVPGNVLGERHKVHLIAKQDEEELTVIHGHQDAQCKILMVKVAVSSLHWFRTQWQGTTKRSRVFCGR